MKMTFEDEQEGFSQPSFFLNPRLWREILLNACPDDGCEPIRDDRGQTYWLKTHRSEGHTNLCVCRRGGALGHAVAKWVGPDEAVLENLIVATPFQGRGLGTVLLHRVIKLARREGVQRLTGLVIRKDAERNPRLLGWYQRWGFMAEPVEAAPPNPRPMSRVGRWTTSAYETVATISLGLGTDVSPTSLYLPPCLSISEQHIHELITSKSPPKAGFLSFN